MSAVVTLKGRSRRIETETSIEALVDELGTLKARLAEAENRVRPLAERAEEIGRLLKASGRQAIDGALYRATISTAERVTLDTAGIRAAMPAEWIARFSRAATVTTLRVVARLTGSA